MTTTTMQLQKAAMRRAARERTVEDLRDGRKVRSMRIESAKGYQRRPKHRGQGWE